MIISLWQGPIPWGHVHSSNTPDLAAHLDRFHLDDSNVTQLGWHWHLVLKAAGKPVTPESPNEDHPTPDPTSEPDAVTAVASHSSLFGLKNMEQLELPYSAPIIPTNLAVLSLQRQVCFHTQIASQSLPRLCRWNC